MPWQVVVHPDALKYLRRIPGRYSARIERALDELKDNPYRGDIEKMEGETETWRRRVGSYRIFFELSVAPRMVFVFRIERRASSTY